MVTMKSLYLNQLRTQATHIKSGQVIITDAPIDNHGRGEAFSPTDLVCAALSSCMETLMGITAQKEQMEMTGLTSEITKVMQILVKLPRSALIFIGLNQRVLQNF